MIKGEMKMKSYRLSKGTTARYTSFEEMALALGRKPITRQEKDADKLEKERESFCKKTKSICSACKKPMTYIGGNQMVCTNLDCKGIKHERTDATTKEVRVWYTPSYQLLSKRDSRRANNIFS